MLGLTSMGFWNQAGIFVRIIAFIWAVIIGLWLLKVTAVGVARMIDRMLRPIERRVLQWLQDRAMARALGVDIDIIRVRRRIETAAEPIVVPTSDGAKRQR